MENKILVYIKKDKNNIVNSYSVERSSSDEIEVELEKQEDIFLYRDNLPYLRFINGNFLIDENLKISNNTIQIKKTKIYELKNMLEETDYKIIKCYEAFMRQLPLPYKLEELAAQRDAWRAEINQLEQELAELE